MGVIARRESFQLAGKQDQLLSRIIRGQRRRLCALAYSIPTGCFLTLCWGVMARQRRSSLINPDWTATVARTQL